MARMKQLLTKNFRRLLAVLVLAPLCAGSGLPPELPDPESIDAFHEYWSAFADYERELIRTGRSNFAREWGSVVEKYESAKRAINAEQLLALEQGAAKYRQHLESHPNADNRPHVMLNLAQILRMIGLQKNELNRGSGTQALEESVAMTAAVIRRFPSFLYREQALYYHAITLETMGREEAALSAWNELLASPSTTVYGVYGRIALGDRHFRKERPADALVAYKSARDGLKGIELGENSEFEILRLNYRIAWSAYRAAELTEVVKTVPKILQPGLQASNLDDYANIRRDAVELLGDALYEQNDVATTLRVLARKDILDAAAAVGERVVYRYNAAGIHSIAAQIGDKIAKEHPLAAATPHVLLLTADSFDKANDARKRIVNLEKLALMLPRQSLWRARQKENHDAISKMEEFAVQAAILAATYHYDRAVASGNAKAYMAAASFFDILIDFDPNGERSIAWRMSKANCYFMAGRHDEASALYRDLKTNFKVADETILHNASYQLILADEKAWRDTFADAYGANKDPREDPETIAALAKMEKSIDEYAARFPGIRGPAEKRRMVDLLLVGASANRDMERFDQASQYWQRALVSEPEPAQRSIAIRGLILAQMKIGSPGDVVNAAKRYLKLEDWTALGLNLGNELQGILSTAALDEGNRLNGQGKVLEAGLLLTEIAVEFPKIPERSKIFRDGGYMLAIAGGWKEAQAAAEKYLKSNLRSHRGDMIYLLARAHESQLRLKDAARFHLDLGRGYPRHGKAKSSLDRAKALAKAEEDHMTVAAASEALGDRSQGQQALDYYGAATEKYREAGDPDAAMRSARKRRQKATERDQIFAAQIDLAIVRFDQGFETEALDDLRVLARRIDANQEILGRQKYGELAGAVRFHLAEDVRRGFDEYDIFSLPGSMGEKVVAKTRLFDQLTRQYDRAAAAGDARWAAEARYRIGVAAESLADDIASIPTRTRERLNLSARTRYRGAIDRLRRLAHKYHSGNVLAARQDPAAYRDVDWVNKSALRLGDEIAADAAAKPTDQVPTAASPALPSAWSL